MPGQRQQLVTDLEQSGGQAGHVPDKKSSPQHESFPLALFMLCLLWTFVGIPSQNKAVSKPRIKLDKRERFYLTLELPIEFPTQTKIQ